MDIVSWLVGGGLIMTFLLNSVYTIIGLVLRIIVGLTLFASAKYNKFSVPLLWGIFGFIFPFLTTLVFYIVYKNNSKKLYCTINEPCFKEVMK